MTEGIIFDIKRYAINDGPGIRTTVFFKGCPLKCAWCHNPESISLKPQKLYTADKCIGCGECVSACPKDACQLTKNGIITNPDLCETCGKCAEVCPTEASEISGQIQSVADIMSALEAEIIFFDQSGGGVTISGGEPLHQPDFLLELLTACQEKDIHRVVDTSGFVKTEILLKVAKITNLFLYDLKMIDEDLHKKYTGVSNKKIIENLKTLAETGADIIIRIPLIKGVNDNDENIQASITLISNLAGASKKINLLPYHNIASRKYQKLGLNIDMDGMDEPTETELQQIVMKFKQAGLEAQIGG